MSHFIPKGFKFAAIYCGIKRDKSREDLTLITSDVPAVAAGVYTKNIMHAAPVKYDRAHTPTSDIRAVVINSGNANAATGEQGLRDAEKMAELAAKVCGVPGRQALVMSTGIIGKFLPMDVIETGIRNIESQLRSGEDAFITAAKGIMTTDTHYKVSSREIIMEGMPVHIAGIAKGAGMIAPNMATFLGVVLTDAPLIPSTAQKLLEGIADRTFNCISVDGHTSTNDSLILLGNGASGVPMEDSAQNKEFCAAVEEVCADLARSIPNDGEGASHLITLYVRGLKSDGDARVVARKIAEDPLFKCAICGNDPNWGRIISGAGCSGISFHPDQVTLHLNGMLLFKNGSPAPFNAADVSASMKANREIVIELDFQEGSGCARFWTCDLTQEYVHINADYHT